MFSLSSKRKNKHIISIAYNALNFLYYCLNYSTML